MTVPLAALVLALSVCGAEGPAPASAPGKLDIYFIDVMGGAATLLVTPERESILIDSGWPGLKDRDPIRIEQVLKGEARLTQLDHLVTTHWHMDHYGGVPGLNRRVKIGRFWDRGLPDYAAPGGDKAAYPDGPSIDDPLGTAYRAASDGKRTALKAGDKLPLKGSIEAVVLASGGAVIAAPPGASPNPLCASAPADQAEDKSDNARSLSFRFKLGDFTFLDCGDLTWNVEKKLVCPVDLVGPIDLFQVTHHGMDISNHPTLLATIAPRVTIMNNGPRKGGAPRTVERIRDLPSVQAAYQLHKNAATPAADNADAAHIANPEQDGGVFIHVAVEPDGSSFTVRTGPAAAGTPATFPAR